MITVQGGSLNIENVTNQYKEVNVTFEKQFSEIPNVQICLRGASANRFINIVTGSITKTGFRLSAYITSGTNDVGVQWIAVGK